MAKLGIFLSTALCLFFSTVTCRDNHPSWCVAKGNIGLLNLNSFVRISCRKDPNRCKIIQPGGLCYDSYSNMVTSTRSQASFLLNRDYARTKTCKKELGEIIHHYPPRTTIGRISFGFLCFPPVLCIQKRKFEFLSEKYPCLLRIC